MNNSQLIWNKKYGFGYFENPQNIEILRNTTKSGEKPSGNRKVEKPRIPS